MNVISLIFGVLAIVALPLGLLPLLGWVNWFLAVPLAVVGLILGLLSRERGGAILCGVALGLAALRLFLGGGFV